MEAAPDGGHAPETIAMHWAQAGRPQRARARYLEAARRDRDRWASRDAIRHYEAALSHGEPRSPRDEAEVRLELATLLNRLDDLPGAIAQATQALAGLTGAKRLQARGHLLLAVAKGRKLLPFEEVQRHAEAAEAIIREHPEPDLQLKLTLHSAGVAWSPGNDLERAAALYEDAVAQCERLGDERELVSTLYLLGRVRFDQGHLDTSEGHFTRACRVAERIGDLGHKGSCTYRLGRLALLRGDHARTLALYHEALGYTKRSGHIEHEATILGALGVIASERGDYDGSLAYFTQCYDLKERLGVRGLWTMLANIALLHNYRGEFERARALAEDSVATARREQYAIVARPLITLSHVALAQGDARLMRHALDLAVVENPALERHDRAIFLESLGHLHRLEGDLKGAEAHLREALALYQGLGHYVYTLNGHIALIRLLLEQGRLGEAQEQLDAALGALSQPSKTDSQSGRLHLLRARLARLRGDLDAASEAMDEAYSHHAANRQARIELIQMLAEGCLLAEARGDDPEPWLNELWDEVPGLTLYPASETAQALRQLDPIDPDIMECVELLTP